MYGRNVGGNGGSRETRVRSVKEPLKKRWEMEVKYCIEDRENRGKEQNKRNTNSDTTYDM